MTYGRLAQLVEHLLDVQEVTGSSPVPSTTSPQTKRSGDFFRGGGTGLEQHGHAAGGATNTPVGCLLVRGSQRLGMSTKKDAVRPFGLGTFFVVAVQDSNGNEQRQGITIMGVSCLLLILTVYGILGLVQQIGICTILELNTNCHQCCSVARSLLVE